MPLTEPPESLSKRTHMPIPSPIATVMPDIGKAMETPGNDLAGKLFAAAVATTIHFFGTTPDALRSAMGSFLMLWFVDTIFSAKIANLVGDDIKDYRRKKLINSIAFVFIATVFGSAAWMGHEWFLLQTGVSGICGYQALSMMTTVQRLGKASGMDFSSISGIFQSLTDKKIKEEAKP